MSLNIPHNTSHAKMSSVTYFISFLAFGPEYVSKRVSIREKSRKGGGHKICLPLTLPNSSLGSTVLLLATCDHPATPPEIVSLGQKQDGIVLNICHDYHLSRDQQI